MKRISFPFFVIFCGLFLVACAGPRMSVSQDWNEKPSSISVAYSMQKLNGFDEVFQEDLPEYSDNFNQWFSEQLVKQLSRKTGIPADKIYVQNVPESNMDHQSFEMKSGVLGDHYQDFPVCKDVEGLPKADAYICLDDVTYKKVYMSYGFGLLGLLFFSGELFVDGTYSIYDGRRRLAYGKIGASEEFMFGTEEDEWVNSVETVVDNLLEGTPIKKK